MKHLKLCLILISLFSLFVIGSNPTLAQEAGDCPEVETENWLNAALLIYVQSDEEINKTAYDINTVAALQALRRRLEDPDLIRPPCADPIYAELIKMINAGADGVVATLIMNSELAETTFTAARLSSEQLDTVLFPELAEVIGISPATPAATAGEPSAEIVSLSTLDGDPYSEGEPVDVNVLVDGTYDPDSLAEGDELWLFVIPPNFRYYPQLIDGCTEDQRSVSANSRRGTWSGIATLGREQEDMGLRFEISIQVADAEESAAMHELFMDWCSSGIYSGLTLDELEEMGFKELDYVTDIVRG